MAFPFFGLVAWVTLPAVFMLRERRYGFDRFMEDLARHSWGGVGKDARGVELSSFDAQRIAAARPQAP